MLGLYARTAQIGSSAAQSGSVGRGLPDRRGVREDAGLTELTIHVGEGVAATGRRFVSAWKRAEAGEAVSERHLAFATLRDAARVLTPERLALLRAIHQRPGSSVRALAEAVGRDYRNVHGNVRVLVEAGLADRDGLGGISADYDAISVEMGIAL